MRERIFKTIGILGGGQLARMSLFAAKRLGFSVAIFDKEKNSPAGQMADYEITGSFTNRKLLKKFASLSDVITLENEFVEHHLINYIEELGKKVYPSSFTVSLIQDKFIQKLTLRQNRIPIPKFTEVSHISDFKIIAAKLKLPFILKSRKMGYDGYGNALVRNENDFTEVFTSLSRRHSKLMAEEFIDFEMELAVMVVRTKKQTVIYPVVQTIQKNHICHTVISPARIEPSKKSLAEKIAVSSVEAFRGYGIFGIEMFLLKNGGIMVNEMAPRPHNSGHYTIEACITSQFENHIRAVMNLPLGSPEMVKPCAVMVNILGKRNSIAKVRNYNKVLENRNVHLHIYGKHYSRKGRKMGHITVTGENLKSVLLAAKKAGRTIII